MRVVLQRVHSAQVRVAGAVTGQIERGYVALIGIARGDTGSDIAYLVRKIVALRLWPDTDGKMNRSLLEAVTPPAVLAVSQFTLLGDTRRGLRPSFDEAAPAEKAKPLYEQFVEALRAAGAVVATGVFQADMEVELVNAGPVTILLDTHAAVVETTQSRTGL